MNRLKELREARGMRKETLADRACVSLSYINLLESAEPPTPGLTRARSIARALSVDVDVLFPPAPDREPAPVPAGKR